MYLWKFHKNLSWLTREKSLTQWIISKVLKSVLSEKNINFWIYSFIKIVPTGRSRPVCFFRFTCHQMYNCFYILYLWTTKSRGNQLLFFWSCFFYNTSEPDLKEYVNSVIKLSDLSFKSKSLQAKCYLNRDGSLSNACIYLPLNCWNSV